MVADQALFIEDGHIILDHDYKAGDKIRVLKKFRGGAAAAKNIEKLTFDHWWIICMMNGLENQIFKTGL